MNVNDIKSFKSIILLNELIANNRLFTTIMNGDNKYLEPLFIEMLSKGYVAISGDRYVATPLGQQAFDTFNARYQEYLKLFDIFAFVDLQAGTFAFSRYFDFNSNEEFDAYKNQDCFDDLRIAVATFKKMNPHEIVFMSFINENRFDTRSTGWQMDLVSDGVWMEIDDIVRSAITIEELGTPDVIEDIVKQGSEIMINLLKEELERKKQFHAVEYGKTTDELYDEGEEIVIVEEEVVYYESYYDPFYVSPIWFAPVFIW